MKLFVKLLALVIALALIGPFFIKGPDGQPLWQLPTSLDQVKLLPQSVSDKSGGVVEVYRWQDDSGQWHFSESAPTQGEFDILTIDTRTNAVMTAPPVAAETEATSAETDIPDNPHIAPALPIPDPQTTRQLIEDAKALQKLADERALLIESEL